MRAPECVWDARARLGEGALWSAREQALYWVDILGHRLHRYSPAQGRRTWQFDEEVSAVAERAAVDGLIMTRRHGFAGFNPATEEIAQLARIEADIPSNRFNDGKCDRQGRFWAGTMDFACKEASGSLYRLTPDLQCRQMDSGYVVTNGPAWSADWRTMYHNDSVNGRVYAFDFDLESGELSNKRLFLQFSPEDGSPDGMTTDADGGLWIAHWGASMVTRHDPQGKILQTIELPCSQVTSCAFGGPDLRTLYITTAADGLSPQQLEREPLAGGLFALETDIAGLPANLFRG
ncbi:MAG TPA: SMP-30/gluconolactonase/LRE family protein [Noviherbaspirillum sp.]|uniref:SMP-30/gluconolactonase/LRE family protein n=1 Tax=Noviherbaspirillum sp. TaxID=1926288 RepID=UPI002D631674|nr:SMP-30/gluconolactonase/LRE family protein [Noviherbaspirillum sp.]HYD95749.1 SMP-30/gluconolactonase/LRE family protein [Noviherbaspirillum sp.]